MRTTVTLDPDVVRLLRDAMRERGISFKEALNEAARIGLRGTEHKRTQKFAQKTFRMGAGQEFRWDKALAIADTIVSVRPTQVGCEERRLSVEGIQSAGWTRMNRMSHRRCLPEAVGRPPTNVFSNTSRSIISFTFMRIQFGRGRLLEPAT